jgi:hypothetical protein
VIRATSLAAAALAIVAALGACGGSAKDGPSAGSEGVGPVVWVKTPQLVVQPELPNDRILFGRIRNDSLRTVDLKSKQIRVLADEREVFGFGRFVDTFVHGNYPVELQPGPDQPVPATRRLGYTLELRPGQTAPLLVTWRLRAGGPRPTTVALQPGMRLGVPAVRPEVAP